MEGSFLARAEETRDGTTVVTLALAEPVRPEALLSSASQQPARSADGNNNTKKSSPPPPPRADQVGGRWECVGSSEGVCRDFRGGRESRSERVVGEVLPWGRR